MTSLLVLLTVVVALAAGQVEVRLPFGNPAGVTLTGAGFANNFAFQGQPQGQPGPQPQPQPQPFSAQDEPQPLAQAQPQEAPADSPAIPQAYAAQPPPQQAYAAQPPPQQAYAAQAAPQQAYAAQPAPQQAYAVQPAPQQAYAVQPAPQQAYAAQPALPLQQPQYAYAGTPVPVPQLAPAPLQYHRAVQYAPAPVAPVIHQHQQYQTPYYAAPPLAAYHQQLGYAATPVLTKVPGVADVPVTKLAYSQGFTQQEVDVHQPAVSTRKVKVRRPALRKDFYDIEHRVIVRPAGSATLELSQPISKEQQGPAVLTPTKYAHIAPVVRYGAGRRIADGPQGPNFGAAFGARNAPPPAQAPEQPQPAQPQSAAPQGPPQRRQPEPAQPRQAVDEDTEVVEAEEQPGQQGRDDIPSDVQPIQDGRPQPGPPQQPQGPPQQPQGPPPPPQGPPPPPQGQDNGRGLTITPDMPLALQNRLLELLTAKGGTVTEILNKDGSPADSASVLQVTDALGDPQLQGGERITTRRIVVTRPIETIQEIEVQEPATKIHRKLVQQPALFKHHVPAVARVPVAVPAVKHVATPVVKTTYTAAHPAAYSFNYQTPQFAYSH